MNISAFCIKHKVTTILAAILISVYGLVLFSSLKLTLIPSMEVPAAFVTCIYSGAGPEEIEELVTRPLESVVATIPGVDEIQSISQENVGIVIIMYDDGTDVDDAAAKLREKFAQLSLPDDCMEPVIYNMDFNSMMPTVTFAIMGEDLGELQRISDKVLSPAMERIDGVASVDVYGGLDTQITVEVDTARLTGYGLSVDYLSNILKASNLIYPGGDVDNGVQTLTVSTDGQFKSVADVANAIIPLPTGGTIRLSEVANVYEDAAVQDTIAKADGMEAVVLSVSKQSNANEVETARLVKEALADIEEDYPNLQVLIAYDSSEYINMTAANAVQNIVLGVVLAALVVFLFLRRPGATAAIAVAMPFCILLVFVAMNLFDITLNMISMGGIAMGVGMIVDNSIIVLENIYRYAGDGYSRYDACTKGTQEVTLSITASTLTTVAVFLPIGLSGGMAGMMFKDFSLTIAFLLLASLVISITLVPLLCYFLLDETKVRQRRLQHDEKAPPLAGIFSTVRHAYMSILRFFLRKRWVGMLVSLGLVVIFVASCMNTEMVLMPDMDQGQVTINVETPVGTEKEQNEVIADRLADIVVDQCPELDSMYYTVSGSGGSSMMSSGSVSMTINLVSASERDRSSKEVATALRAATRDIAGCEITVDSSAMSMSTGSDVQVEILGDEYDVLGDIANDLKLEIEKIPGTINLESSLEAATPAVKVNVRHSDAAMYGLTAASIGAAVRAELTGATATTITVNGNDIDVVIKGNDATSANLDALRSMPLSAATGGQVPLSAVADVVVELSPQSISRYNQSRQVNITGDLDGTVPLATVTEQIMEILDAYDMPEGYSASAGGTYEDMMDSFGDLILALVVALGLVYFVLASQFESFIMPIIVMLILPVALTGALFGLPLTGSDLSMVSIVGLIMLAGVVVNSSIVLVDYIKIRRLAGESKNEAILQACPLRIRPIMMTTLTTILAMVPMAVGTGEGSEMMKPMAVVMITGMIISTIVTLFFTPVYYSVLDSITEWFTSRGSRKKKKQEEAALPTA